jgi:hypothetical protein
MMRQDYATDGPGKFEGEPPMTRYLYERIVLNGSSDDSASSESGDWADLVGRRIVVGDSQGFVASHKYANRFEARAIFDEYAAELAPLVDGMHGQWCYEHDGWVEYCCHHLDIGMIPVKHGDPCPQCQKSEYLRWGLWAIGTVKVQCKWCGWDNYA